MRAAILCLALLLAGAARADAHKIDVGVYVNNISQLDIKTSQYTVDFYIWFRWDGSAAELNPLESFELPNGRITSKTGVSKRTFGTQRYAACRVLATITKVFDMTRFPLDDHTLTIEIEDSDLDTRVAELVADSENATVRPDLVVPGWEVVSSGSKVITYTYRTNYGDISLPHGRQSSYSRYIFAIHIERPGYGRFLRVFFGLFVAALISWCAFHVRPKESSPRVSLGIGATFAAAAVTVAINNSLPDTNSVTMADQLIMLTLGVIVSSVIVTIVALALAARGKDAAQRKLDKVCAIGFPIAYLALLVYIIS